jgi:putative DNA primase/helicase
MELNKLQMKYNNVPSELKVLKRWVCFKVEGLENGKTTKRPYNALNGGLARVNDELTWTNFNTALKGCVKYKCDGIGFILGHGIFGIDLDNHPDEDGTYPLSDEEFKILTDEFVTTLDSYSERSQSGKGVHIICQGILPPGSRRKKGSPVEMYDKSRFFAFTGDVIHNVPINNREKEVVSLWEKYVKSDVVVNNGRERKIVPDELKLDDKEVIETALSSSSGEKFYRYYYDGDISMNGNDHSSADMSFCCMLAFWCNGDEEQMDRIFRNSALYREKWDKYRGEKTYGEITIEAACRQTPDGYVKQEIVKSTIKNKDKKPLLENVKSEQAEMNLDAFGEPIFKIKKIFKSYTYSDTGNAERFYDYFGELFKYNVTDKTWFFWTGKTWIKDSKDIIRKYANKFIEILHEEEERLYKEQAELEAIGKKDAAKMIEKKLDACRKNTARVANKAGKDAMLSELKVLYDIPLENWEFNQDDFLLNTDSGVVDLRSGNVYPFDKEKLMTKNTGHKVSFEEPTTWLKFLYSVFDCGDDDETNSLIESLQTCLGYSLTGSVREQVMFLLYGGGSNGKSVLTETIAHIIGDYSDNIASSTLMQQKGTQGSTNFSLAKLQTCRFVETGETDEGGKLAEAQLKILTGGDQIAAQFKFGNEFSYKPKFKIWMSTNNPPIIRGTDFGIWRRVIVFEFKNTFTGDKKDKDLPDKLKAEADKILGWLIQGCLKYLKANKLLIAKSQITALELYKESMDVVAQFLRKECILHDERCVECKMLYNHYKEWALNNTDYVMKERKFSTELKNKGIETVFDIGTGKDVYKGLYIKGYLNIKDKGD